MQVTIGYGRRRVTLEVARNALINGQAPAAPTALADPAASVRNALERPLDFPALRRALTPDDQIAVLVDERLPQLPSLLVPVLEHILGAGVSPEAVTLLCPPPPTAQPWLDDLPDELADVRCEVHAPRDRGKLSFVTTMSKGRQLFMNRTLVDAAQVVVLAGRRFDPLLGHAGGEGALFPAFSDVPSRSEASRHLTLDAPGDRPWPVQEEAAEAAWLLGVPFFVQVIEGAGDEVADVLAGTSGSLAEGQRRYEARWKHTVPGRAHTVVASVSGDPARQGLADLADALTSAARAVRPGGRIILLSEARPEEGTASGLIRDADDPAGALAEVRRRKELDLRSAWQWAAAAERAEIFLLCDLPADTVEEMFACPLERAEQAQRLLDVSESCLFLADAHKTMALVEE